MLAKLAVRFRQLADMLDKEARALNTLPLTSRVTTWRHCMASRRSRPTSCVDQQLLHGLVHPVLGKPAQDRVPPPSPTSPLPTSLKKRGARGRGLSGRGGKYLGNLGNLGVSTLLNASLSLRRPEGLSHSSTFPFYFETSKADEFYPKTVCLFEMMSDDQTSENFFNLPQASKKSDVQRRNHVEKKWLQ